MKVSKPVYYVIQVLPKGLRASEAGTADDKKFNLHRRIAEVEVSFLKRRNVLYWGIEIIGGES